MYGMSFDQLVLNAIIYYIATHRINNSLTLDWAASRPVSGRTVVVRRLVFRLLFDVQLEYNTARGWEKRSRSKILIVVLVDCWLSNAMPGL